MTLDELKEEIRKQHYSMLTRQENAQKRVDLRKAAVKKLGNCCARCGETDTRLLDIDHVSGDGHKNKKENNSAYNKQMQIINGSDRFQLLCCNCHRLKTLENEDHLQNHKTVSALKAYAALPTT